MVIFAFLGFIVYLGHGLAARHAPGTVSPIVDITFCVVGAVTGAWLGQWIVPFLGIRDEFLYFIACIVLPTAGTFAGAYFLTLICRRLAAGYL